MYWIFHTSGMKTAVEIHQLVTTIQQCCIGNSQAQQLQWLWMALSFCLMVKRNFDDIAEVTHSLFCFLRNATGLIPDLEGDTEATSTSDLPSSKEPSCVMGRAAALCCSASATLKTRFPVILKQIFPPACVSVLVAGILRPTAVWQRCITGGTTGGFLCNRHSWRRYQCTESTVILAPFPAETNTELLKLLCTSMVPERAAPRAECPTGAVQWFSCSLEPYLRVWFWHQRASEDDLSWINTEIQEPLRKGHSSLR